MRGGRDYSFAATFRDRAAIQRRSGVADKPAAANRF